MPKPTKGPRLGGGPAHERLLLANLAAALFTHKAITTTETKAKRLRPLAERLITFAKRGDLHARRRVLSVIHDKTVVHVLFTEIAPLVAEREGGYTRIIKTGFRKGDNAPMAVIELVLEPVTPKKGAAAKPKSEKMEPAEPVGADEAEVEPAASAEAAETAEAEPAAEPAPVAASGGEDDSDTETLGAAESDPSALSAEGTVTVDVPVDVPAAPAEDAEAPEDAESSEESADAAEVKPDSADDDADDKGSKAD